MEVILLKIRIGCQVIYKSIRVIIQTFQINSEIAVPTLFKPNVLLALIKAVKFLVIEISLHKCIL